MAENLNEASEESIGDELSPGRETTEGSEIGKYETIDDNSDDTEDEVEPTKEMTNESGLKKNESEEA